MFVCTGNTCRSPMAYGILKSMIKAENIEGVEVVSAGTGTLDGYPATAYSVQATKKDGIDISDHYSQSLTSELVERADLILVLALEHHVYITSKYPESSGKTFMLKAFPDRDPSPELSVDDPIGADFEKYLSTYNEIKNELLRAWPAIKQRIDEKLH